MGLALVLLPLCIAAAPAELYFSDDFQAGSEHYFYEGTLDGREFRYADDEYEIDTTRGQSYGQSVLLDQLDTYRVQVTGRMVKAKDAQSGFGLSLNYNEREGASGGDFVLFLAYDRGAYTVLRYLDGKTSVLYSPTKTQLFNPGEAATLTVDAAKGQLTFYINGAEAASLREDKLTSGGFGVFATAQSIARFDDFRVYAAKKEQTGEAQGLTDDFSGEKKLFEGTWGDATYAYDGGRYVIDTSRTEYIGLSPLPGEATDFELGVDVELLSGEPIGGYGLYVRDYKNESGAFNQFRFLVSILPSGNWFAVEQSLDERPLALAEWAESKAVQPQGVNRLTVRAQEGELEFLVNGEEVWKGTDARPHAGALGFFVSGGIKVAFDNLSLKKL